MVRDEGSFPRIGEAAWTERERRLGRFEEEWRGRRGPRIEDYLEGGSGGSLLVELVLIDLEFRLGDGERVEVADYLRRFPGLAGDDATLRTLLEAAAAPRGLARLGARDAEGGRPPELFGRYELLGQVGAGSFGVVHRARDTRLGRVVALKIPRAALCHEPTANDRFFREARILARLRHPGIVAVHDAGMIEGVFALVSEFVEGENLAERLARGKVPLRQAVAWVVAIAEAVEAAHQADVVHRDLKPANVMIDGEGRPRVMDFGLACLTSESRSLTVDGELLGTPAYMAPEQAAGRTRDVDERSDVYSLGVILYELIAGRLPFPGDRRSLAWKVAGQDVPTPRRWNPAIPRDLETVCLKALDLLPAGRYQRASELAEDLSRFLRGEPVKARPARAAAKLWRRCRRRPALSAAVAAVALAAAVGSGFVIRQWRAAEQYRAQAEVHRRDSVQGKAHLLASLRSWQRVIHSSAALGRSQPDSWRLMDEALPTIGGLISECDGLIELLGGKRGLEHERARFLALKAELQWQLGRLEPSLASWRSARDCLRGLNPIPSGDPDPGVSRSIGYVQLRMSRLLSALGRHSEATEAARESVDPWAIVVEHAERSAAERPDSDAAQWALANAVTGYGDGLSALGRHEEALPQLERGWRIWFRLSRRDPYDLSLGDQLLGSCQHFSDLAASVHRAFLGGRCSEEFVGRVVGAMGRVCEGVEDDVGPDLGNLALVSRRASCHSWKATLENDLGRTADALAGFRRAAALFEQVLATSPSNLPHRRSLAACHHNLGRTLFDAGRLAEAVDSYRTAIAQREAIRLGGNALASDHGDCAGTWHRLGLALEALRRIEEARSSCERSIEIARIACRLAPESPRFREALEEHERQLSRLDRRRTMPVSSR